MKYLSLMLVLALSLSVMLVACGSQESEPAEETAPAASTAPSTTPASAAPAPTSAPAASTAPSTPAQSAPAQSGEMTVGVRIDTHITEMVAVPASFQEAPILAARVAAGELPPVEERLPDKPLVMIVDEPGEYGGQWRRVHLGPGDASCNVGRANGRGATRFGGDGLDVVPHAIKGWETKDGGSTWTVHLLEGMKWSDGAPFTADDFVYAYEVQTDPEIKSAPPVWIRQSGDPVVQVVKIDDYTVEFRYAQPFYFFTRHMAHGCTVINFQYAPAHYLKQFNLKYNPDAEKLAEEAGFPSWAQYYLNQEDPKLNPDRPATSPWVWTNSSADDIIRLTRNPYYPIVDQEGNQLPYIDEVRFQTASGVEPLNLRAAQGEIDFQGRHINFANFPVLKEGEDRGNYKIQMVVDPMGSDIVLYFNITYPGAEGELINNKDWRIAMSHSLDRHSIQEITMGGQGIVRNALPAADHPFYPGDDYETKHIEYDVEMSNSMLDEVMGAKDGEDFRTLPNGDRFAFRISTMDAFGGYVDGAEQMCQYFQAVGVRCTVDVVERSLLNTQAQANELMSRVHNADLTAELFSIAFHTLPTNPIFGWAADYARWFQSGGDEGTQPPEEIKHLLDILLEASGVPPEEQNEIAQEIFAWTIDNQVRLGTVGASGLVSGIVIVNNDLVNVPAWWANRAGLNMPFNSFPDQFWYRSEERRMETQQ